MLDTPTPEPDPADTVAGRADALLAWYDRHRRRLPWRALPGAVPDPYAVWLSEIMLQQTTVAAVKDYYVAFLARWPDVAALAAAPADEVMRLWAGLGYYSRARNLHACAKTVATTFAGRFPDTEAGLRALPGIGPYTAAAIAAIAFGRRAVVIDGNVERVVSRLAAITQPLPAAKPHIRAVAETLTPQARAGDFAQAMMDLGATICTPRRPTCALCPFFASCAARREGIAAELPRKAPKAERPQRRGAAFVLRRDDGCVLVRTRAPRGLLGGMTELPGTDWVADDAFVSPAPPLPSDCKRLPAPVTHGFTHFELTLEVFVGAVAPDTPAPAGCRWVDDAALDAEALPTLMRKVVAAARGSTWWRAA